MSHVYQAPRINRRARSGTQRTPRAPSHIKAVARYPIASRWSRLRSRSILTTLSALVALALLTVVAATTNYSTASSDPRSGASSVVRSGSSSSALPPAGDSAAPGPGLPSGLGRALAARRRELNMSQAEVAAIAHISQPVLDRIERGRSDVNLSTLQELLPALQLIWTIRARP